MLASIVAQATQETLSNGQNFRNGNGEDLARVSTHGSVEPPQHPSQQAQPERELGSLCSSLQVAAAAANNDLRVYLLAHADQRASIVPLSRELVSIQAAARLYIRHVGLDERTTNTLPRPLLRCLTTVVHHAERLVSDVMNILETSSMSSRVLLGQVNLTGGELAVHLGKVTEAAGISTAALNLGLDAMALGPLLQSAPPQPPAPDLPAYQASQLLQDTLSLRLRIANLNFNDRIETPAVIRSISHLLDRLQSHIEQGSNSLLVPPIPDSSAEPILSRTDSLNLRPDMPQSANGLLQPASQQNVHPGQQSPAYDSLRIQHPAPSTLSLRHVSRKPTMYGEIFTVAFVAKNTGELYIAANTMSSPTKFFSLHGSTQFTTTYTGGYMTFAPESSGSTSWAYTIEDEVGGGNAAASLWQHDGSDFRKPILCIGDYTTSKKFQKLRMWGIRPLCFSPDGQRLAVTNNRHRISFLDAAHQFGMRPDEGIITSHTEEITHAVFTPDSHALVSASRDGTIRLTDPFSMESLAKLDTGTWKRPCLLGVAPDSNVIVSVWGDVVYRWDHTTGAVDSYALGSRRGAAAREGWPVALSPDCRFLLCRTEEGADVSDAHSGRVLFTVRFSRGFLTAAAFSADSRYLAVGKAASCVGPKVHQATIDVWELEY